MELDDLTKRDAYKKAIELSRQQTATSRLIYARLVKKIGGIDDDDPRNGPRSAGRRRIANKLRQSYRTIRMQLSSGRLRWRVKCDMPDERRSFARKQQTHLNLLADELKITKTCSKIVGSAFFKIGIGFFTTIEGTPLLFGTDSYVRVDKPHFSWISYEDYGHDMSARGHETLSFQYHYFDIDDDALDDSKFDKSVVKAMRASGDDRKTEDEGKNSARETYGYTPNKDRSPRKKHRCIHLYLNQTREVYVYPFKMETAPLWKGVSEDPDGPYRLLSFDDIPDNTLPSAQAEALEPLDDLNNSTWRVAARLTKQMRQFLAVESGHEEDADKQRKAQHGEVVVVRSLEGSEIREFGGVNKNVAGTLSILDSAYNTLDDNLSLRAGLGPSSPTATQDAQLGQASAGMAAQQKAIVLDFYASVGEGLRRRMWNDEVMARDAYSAHPELPEYLVPDHWTPGHRVGELKDYACEVIPDSIAYRSGQQQAQSLLASFQQLAQFAPPDQQPDFDAIVGDLADLLDQPELRRWFRTVEADPEQVAKDAVAPRNKTSTQIRRSEAAADAMNPMASAVAMME